MDSYKLLIFDWDGTLMDSADRIVLSMQNAADKLALSRPDDSAVRNIIGLSLEPAIYKIVPGISALDNKRLADEYSRQFKILDQTPSPFYPEVMNTLLSLKSKGYILAVATGKSRKGLDRVLAATQLDSVFEVTRGADETKSKPDPLMLKEILEHTQIDANNALMIGDTSYDLEMAENINMKSIAVSYGMHSVDVLQRYNPIATVSCFSHIERWLDNKVEQQSE